MSDLFIRILWKKAAGCQKFKPRQGKKVQLSQGSLFAHFVGSVKNCLVFYTGQCFPMNARFFVDFVPLWH
jgi:hypothetical protein